jgi:hypothetical protein
MDLREIFFSFSLPISVLTLLLALENPGLFYDMLIGLLIE